MIMLSPAAMGMALHCSQNPDTPDCIEWAARNAALEPWLQAICISFGTLLVVLVIINRIRTGKWTRS